MPPIFPHSIPAATSHLPVSELLPPPFWVVRSRSRGTALGRSQFAEIGRNFPSDGRGTLHCVKDWLDIEQMLLATDELDVDQIEGWLERMVGKGDPRLKRLDELNAKLATAR
jgi:hypothetical protein